MARPSRSRDNGTCFGLHEGREKSRPKLSSIRDKIAASQGWRCGYCHRMFRGGFDVDHIVPWSVTHNSDESNLVAACLLCHRSKSTAEHENIAATNRKIKEFDLCGFNPVCFWPGCKMTISKFFVAQHYADHRKSIPKLATFTKDEPPIPKFVKGGFDAVEFGP